MSTPNDVIGLRDYFAAAALSGIIFEWQTRIGDKDLTDAQVKTATVRAYRYAATVIAKRAALRMAEEEKKAKEAKDAEVEPA